MLEQQRPPVAGRSWNILVENEHRHLDDEACGEHAPRMAGVPAQHPRERREHQVDLHRDEQEIQLILARTGRGVVCQVGEKTARSGERIVVDDEAIGDRVHPRPDRVRADDESESSAPELCWRHIPPRGRQHEDIQSGPRRTRSG